MHWRSHRTWLSQCLTDCPGVNGVWKMMVSSSLMSGHYVDCGGSRKVAIRLLRWHRTLRGLESPVRKKCEKSVISVALYAIYCIRCCSTATHKCTVTKAALTDASDVKSRQGILWLLNAATSLFCHFVIWQKQSSRNDEIIGLGCHWAVGDSQQEQISSLLEQSLLTLFSALSWNYFHGTSVFVCVCAEVGQIQCRQSEGTWPEVIIGAFCFLTNITDIRVSPGDSARQKQSSPITKLTLYCYVVFAEAIIPCLKIQGHARRHVSSLTLN